MPSLVDKLTIKNICIDDFAFRKRYSYGTVMVDLDTHRIVDIIDTRETTEVATWLKTYPNLEVISRDGAQTYASAAMNACPHAIQVSDRFHLLKNLSEAAERYMRRLFPSRLEIPATASSRTPEMQALYNTRNRGERIRFAQAKRKEGYTINDIALLLHAATTTVQRYLAIDPEQIPSDPGTAREREHQKDIARKQEAIKEVKRLYAEGHSINEISILTGHIHQTVKKYLNPACALSNGHYDIRRPGKLAAYEEIVIEMRSQGISYPRIHDFICAKGYTGTVASLRMFMQKEREHQKSVATLSADPKEYIPRKFMCQLIYRKLEDVKGITSEQYEAALKTHPILGSLYFLLKEFHRIVFSQKSEELVTWINSAESLNIDEITAYVNGLKNDIQAVKNGIKYKFNNGLAEGSVNKIKLIKRIMYGRNSFKLLKAKVLLNELHN